MKIILKLCCAIPLLLCYFILAIPLYPFLFISPYKTRYILNHMVHYLCKLLLFALSVEVKLEGKMPKIDEGKLIVCNHVSYLDILIIASKFPTCFVTSNEMKETPGLGLLCILGGCVFVERRNRENIGSEVDEIKVALEKGLCVMFFPEAGSTSGDKVIPFKRSLFHAAVVANANTLPLCLNYISLNGELISTQNRDNVFWYGDMDFAPHFATVCRQKKIVVELSVLSQISLKSVNNDSKLLRDKAFLEIEKKYRKLSSTC